MFIGGAGYSRKIYHNLTCILEVSMNGFASCTIVGNLVRDPAMKYLPNGTPLAEFGIAVNERWKDANGEKKEEVSYFDVVTFGKTAEFASQWLTKGKPVAIEGKIQQRRWETEDGQKRSKHEVVANRIHFLPDGKGQQAGTDAGEGGNEPAE